jgi:hypothetical protein
MRENDREYMAYDAVHAMKKIGEEAQRNGPAKMSLDEISAEIAAARQERQNTRRSSTVTNSASTPDTYANYSMAFPVAPRSTSLRRQTERCRL